MACTCHSAAGLCTCVTLASGQAQARSAYDPLTYGTFQGQDDLDKQESLTRHWKAEAERQAAIAQVYNHSSADFNIRTAAYVSTQCARC